jgi:hypothetical protein
VKQLQAFGPQLPGSIYRSPGDVAARLREARYDAVFDRIAEGPNDRNYGGCGFEI